MLFYAGISVTVTITITISVTISVSVSLSLSVSLSVSVSFVYFCILKLPEAAFWQVHFPAEKTVMLLCVIPEPDPLSVDKDGVGT